jgi:hypothetical protein
MIAPRMSPGRGQNSDGSPDARPTAGASDMARAFDADVSVGGTGPALFYVSARSGTPDAAVRSVGGELVSRLTSERQALALAPLAAHAALRDHPELEIAGPVMIDAERFNRFSELTRRASLQGQKASSQSKPDQTQSGETQ